MRAPGRGVEVSQRVSRSIAGSSDLVPNLGNLTKYLFKKKKEKGNKYCKELRKEQQLCPVIEKRVYEGESRL